MSKVGLGFGCLRAVVQGYTYIYIYIELESNFQNNLKSFEVNWIGAWMAARGGARLQLQLQ